MQVRNDALAGVLARAQRTGSLPPIFVVASNEALLSLEAQDAIRSTARGLGYSERDVLNADARFDWSKLAESAQALSLFAEKKIVELRLPGGKPGVGGAKALEAHALNAIDGVTTIVSLPRLERRDRQARWVEALERAGVMVDIDTIERAQLPQWISQRLAKQNQSAGRDALDFVADKVEGNLLAAHQEVCKLALLYPAGQLTLEQVTDSVLNVARYDVFQLPIAMLGGDAARVCKTMAGLEAEGEAIPLVLWVITEELRTLLLVKAHVDAGRPFSVAARENRLWGPRERLFERALARVSSNALEAALLRSAEIDRIAKGLLAPRTDCNVWLELTELALSVVRIPASAVQ